MKVPYLSRRIQSEFEEYLEELSTQVSESTSEAKSSAESLSAYRALFPLFLLLRKLDDVAMGVDPSRAMLLDQLRLSGNKAAFLEVVWAKPFSATVRQALESAGRDLRVTSFLGELWSDSLLCLNSFCTRNYRGANIALRCMLEDLYRHLYFKDHVQEYGELRSNPDAIDEFKISPSGLRDYLPKTSYLRIFAGCNTSFEKKEEPGDRDWFSVNQDLYGRTSGFVHGTRLSEMNAFKSNASFVRKKDREHELGKALRDFVSMSTAFLAAAHLGEFRAIDDYEKSIIFEAFDSQQKHGFRALLNV